MLILLASIGFGLTPYFARLVYATGIPPEAAAFYRFALPALVLMPTLAHTRRFPRLTLIAIAAGTAMGVGTAAYFQALEELPIALAALIFFTYPVFTIAFGRVFFQQSVSAVQITAGVLVCAGAAVAIGPSFVSPQDPVTILKCFLAPIAYGILLNLLATTLAPIPTLSKTAATLLGCSLATLPFALLSAPQALPADPFGYLAIAALAFGTLLVPALLLVAGAPRAGVAATGVISAAELVVAISCGWLLLAEPVRFSELIGGGLVLSAALLVGHQDRRRRRHQEHRRD